MTRGLDPTPPPPVDVHPYRSGNDMGTADLAAWPANADATSVYDSHTHGRTPGNLRRSRTTRLLVPSSGMTRLYDCTLTREQYRSLEGR